MFVCVCARAHSVCVCIVCVYVCAPAPASPLSPLPGLDTRMGTDTERNHAVLMD